MSSSLVFRVVTSYLQLELVGNYSAIQAVSVGRERVRKKGKGRKREWKRMKDEPFIFIYWCNVLLTARTLWKL